MATTIRKLSDDVGVSVDELIALCRRVGVIAWSGDTPLDETEEAQLRDALANPPAPTPAPGSPSEWSPPGSAPATPPPAGWVPPPPPPGSAAPGALPPPPPGAAWGSTYGVPAGPVRTHGLAVTSFILGLVGWIVGLGSVIALILGIRSLRDINRPGSGLGGRGFAVAGIVLGGLGIALAGLVIVGLVLGETTDLPTNREEAGFELVVGDCYDDKSRSSDNPDEAFTVFVDEINCFEPHDAEVYSVTEYPGGIGDPYPGDKRLGTHALQQCQSRFTEFVGTPYQDSELDFVYLYPDSGGWEDVGDRSIVCAVYAINNDKLVGSMRNSRR